MRMRRRIISLLLASVLLVLAGCGGGGGDSVEDSSPEPTEPVKLPVAEKTPASKSLTDGVILGRSVFMHDNDVVFWCVEDTLCSGLVDLSGQVYDFYAEGRFPLMLWSVAIRGDDCVLGASEGMFLMSLSAFGQGVNEIMKLNMHAVYDGFSILDDYIYYLAEDELYRVAFTGEGETRITSGVCDFELTSDGIYYTLFDGGLYRMGLDGGDREKLTDTSEGTRLFTRDSDILCWSEKDSSVFLWNVEEASSQEIVLRESLAEGECLWPMEENAFIYTDDDDEVHRYTITDGSDEVLDELSILPNKEQGCVRDNVLYYCYANTLLWDDLVTFQSGVAELGEEFPAAPAIGTQEGSGQQPQQTQQPQTSGGEFDISANIDIQASQGYALLINDYFSVSLPALPEWEVEVVDKETLDFIYPPAAEAGYGGWFLTIKAYDWADNSYEDFPAWSMAGMDENKKYVAIFPTDVQFDPNSDTQAEEYNILFSEAQKINCNDESGYNPFYVINP